MKKHRLRSSKKSVLSLRVRLTLLVSAELVLCVLVALGLYLLLEPHIMWDSRNLLLLDLLLTGLLIGSVVTSILSKLFFDPIKKLRKAMSQVAEGDFSVRLPERSSSSEIREIYSGFNLMAQELSATEMLQSDFVSNVSHEFKTPLSAIEGYSMLLQSCENLNEDQAQYVEKILFNTKRLSSLMGSILLLSKLEHQQIRTNRTTYRLDEQIRQSIVSLEPAWEEKQIEFDVRLQRVEYHGNEAMMHHVWDNLISNAIKFTPENSTVKITLTADECVTVTVEDEGCGISEETAKHMFDKFYQADTSHKQEGNGLGLALVKRILILEQGTITAENLKKGCRFTVTLPIFNIS